MVDGRTLPSHHGLQSCLQQESELCHGDSKFQNMREALVKEYARRGVHPIATVLPNEPSDHLSDAGITFFTLNVTVEESVAALKGAVHDLTGGRLDVLVNCA
ncbi:NADPH-dependent 1-acyl dihydroxyacetone phosphate reductase [Diatrype stigma]|uniref:NADPH-dependent 1-acyl dihydroxyacetone phosphate reductase n=1 Tax=Diatrype stigma TaxID=117547 RepID=A0AAN9YDU8_9PEZI